MKRLLITSINFKYENGQDKPISGVDVHFNSYDTPFNLSGKVTLSRDMYNSVQNDTEALKELVLSRVADYFGKKLEGAE